MHSAIIITVEAEDKSQALEYATEFAHSTSWSDWNELGGRWDDLTEGSILKYSDDPAKFDELVEAAEGWQASFIRDVLAKIGDITVRDLATNPKYDFMSDQNRQESLKLREAGDDDGFRAHTLLGLSRWNAHRLFSVLSGEFHPETGHIDLGSFVDIGNHMDLNDRCAKNPDQQFLLVWDFHH